MLFKKIVRSDFDITEKKRNNIFVLQNNILGVLYDFGFNKNIFLKFVYKGGVTFVTLCCGKNGC